MSVKEIFVPVKGYEGKYEISNLRRIKSLHRVVKRCDGIKRTISEKIILSDKVAVGLGKGYGKGGRNHDVVNLMASSFFPNFSTKTHKVVFSGSRKSVTLKDIGIVKRK